MSKQQPQRPTTTTHDVPATVPTVAPRRADWSGWSADYERKRLESEAAARQQIADGGRYPRELADKMAVDLARQMVPDWRMARHEFGAAYRRVLSEQPELQIREVKQLPRLLALIGDNLPEH
jgi:hypothetical protein